MFKSKINFHYNKTINKQKLFQKFLAEYENKISDYYDLPFDKAMLVKQINNYKKSNQKILNSFKHIVVIGIGGSTLGAKAIDSALNVQKFTKPLYFLESSDPLKLNRQLQKISLIQSLFLVISKSGNTIETISILKLVLSLFGKNNLSSLRKHFIFITDKHSPLYKLGQAEQIKNFVIPANVGGRFSVLSAVGLVPLALVNYNIADLLNGARIIYNTFFTSKQDRYGLLKKACFFSAYKKQYSSNILFSYSSLLKDFNDWYSQLWGESLGKIDLDGRFSGLTPIGLIGPQDQHSFLQLILQGQQNKTVTFLKVKHFPVNLDIPDICLNFLESCDFVNASSFEKLINSQCHATMQAVNQAKIPNDFIEIETLNEKSLGFLMFYFELLTSLTGVALKINTYNQPGVEIGKKILKDRFNEF